MENQRRRLITVGVLLFLVALFVGIVFPYLKNPRMGLSAHVVGLLGGLFLIVLGLIWSDVKLSKGFGNLALWSAVVGSFANVVATFLAAAFATNRLTVVAGSGRLAAPWQENIVTAGLALASVAMLTACILVLWGLRRKAA